MAVIESRKGRDGRIVFRVKIRLKGRPVETKTFERKTDAKIWAEDREATLRRERNLGLIATAEKTLGDLIDRYIRDELPKRRSDSVYAKTCLEWWRGELGDLKLKDVSPSRLAECRDKLMRAPHKAHKFGPSKTKTKSPATTLRYMMALSHVYTIAMTEWEWVSVNPVSLVKKPTLPRGRVRVLDDQERAALLSICEESDCPYLLHVVVIALSTGARYSEILNLRWRDIDLERGIARLEQTKNGERRAVPLLFRALELVKRLHNQQKPGSHDFLFPRADGLAPIAIQKYWKAAIQAADIKDFRFHDLRHSAASYLAMNGATLAELAEILGHKTLRMVKRYVHFNDQHTASVVERMNRKIFAANDNEEQVLQKTRKRK